MCSVYILKPILNKIESLCRIEDPLSVIYIVRISLCLEVKIRGNLFSFRYLILVPIQSQCGCFLTEISLVLEFG